MEPLSVAAAAGSLAFGTANAVKQISTFVSDVRAARKDMDAVSRELVSIQLCLEAIEGDGRKRAISYPKDVETSLKQILVNVETTIAQISNLLFKLQSGRLGRRVQWALSSKQEVNKFRSSLESNKTALEIAPSLGTISMLASQTNQVLINGIAIDSVTQETGHVSQTTTRIERKLDSMMDRQDQVAYFERLCDETYELRALLETLSSSSGVHGRQGLVGAFATGVQRHASTCMRATQIREPRMISIMTEFDRDLGDNSYAQASSGEGREHEITDVAGTNLEKRSQRTEIYDMGARTGQSYGTIGLRELSSNSAFADLSKLATTEGHFSPNANFVEYREKVTQENIIDGMVGIPTGQRSSPTPVVVRQDLYSTAARSSSGSINTIASGGGFSLAASPTDNIRQAFPVSPSRGRKQSVTMNVNDEMPLLRFTYTINQDTVRFRLRSYADRAIGLGKALPYSTRHETIGPLMCKDDPEKTIEASLQTVLEYSQHKLVFSTNHNTSDLYRCIRDLFYDIWSTLSPGGLSPLVVLRVFLQQGNRILPDCQYLSLQSLDPQEDDNIWLIMSSQLKAHTCQWSSGGGCNGAFQTHKDPVSIKGWDNDMVYFDDHRVQRAPFYDEQARREFDG